MTLRNVTWLKHTLLASVLRTISSISRPKHVRESIQKNQASCPDLDIHSRAEILDLRFFLGKFEAISDIMVMPWFYLLPHSEADIITEMVFKALKYAYTVSKVLQIQHSTSCAHIGAIFSFRDFGMYHSASAQNRNVKWRVNIGIKI